jgi:hypothetical protein
MKYNTLLVPVIAFATLATALPSDASGNGHGYPSDQGKYQPRPQDKSLKQEETAWLSPSSLASTQTMRS